MGQIVNATKLTDFVKNYFLSYLGMSSYISIQDERLNIVIKFWKVCKVMWENKHNQSEVLVTNELQMFFIIKKIG